MTRHALPAPVDEILKYGEECPVPCSDEAFGMELDGEELFSFICLDSAVGCGGHQGESGSEVLDCLMVK